MTNGTTEMVQKDIDGDGHLILEANSSTIYRWKTEDGGKDLKICLGNQTDDLFKGSHFGVTCEKTALVRIVPSCIKGIVMGISFLDFLHFNLIFSLYYIKYLVQRYYRK